MTRYGQKLRNLLFGAMAASLVLGQSFAYGALSPREMLKKADEARGNAKGVVWRIDIRSVEKGRERQRTLRVSARHFNSLAEFLSPPNVKGQKLLMIDRNMWFAKPGLSKPVPISPRQKLLGGAANGDIASTNYAGDYQIVKTSQDVLNGEKCVLFDLKALDNRATYDRILYWVSTDRVVGVKAEFFTVSGKMFKTAVFQYDNRITIDGKPREFISKMIITSALIKNDVTTMTYGRVEIREIPDSTFNLNLLTR